jgi:hypothetical protein
MLREDQVMNEVVRPVATTEDEAVAWIAQALDEGDFAKEADSYRLVKRFGLDLEPISTAWDEKRRDAKARLAADRARLTNLSARVAKVKPTSFILPKDRNKYLGARPPEPQPAENRGPAGEVGPSASVVEPVGRPRPPRDVDEVREVLFNSFPALSAFIAAHSNSDQIAILSSLVARKATFLLALI